MARASRRDIVLLEPRSVGSTGSTRTSRRGPSTRAKTPFGWESFTTQEECVRVRAYGKNLHEGNIVARWTELADEWTEVLNVIIDHGDGPTKGIGDGQVWINDLPVEKFTEVAVQERLGTILGTMDQTGMDGCDKLKLSYELDIELLDDAPPNPTSLISNCWMMLLPP